MRGPRHVPWGRFALPRALHDLTSLLSRPRPDFEIGVLDEVPMKTREGKLKLAVLRVLDTGVARLLCRRLRFGYFPFSYFGRTAGNVLIEKKREKKNVSGL